MATLSSSKVLTQRIKNKKEGVIEQLNALEKAKGELEAVTVAVDEELEASLCFVKDYFSLVQELVDEKKKECYHVLKEIVTEQKTKIQEWTAKVKKAVCKTSKVDTCILYIIIMFNKPSARMRNQGNSVVCACVCQCLSVCLSLYLSVSMLVIVCCDIFNHM